MVRLLGFCSAFLGSRRRIVPTVCTGIKLGRRGAGRYFCRTGPEGQRHCEGFRKHWFSAVDIQE